MGAASSILPAAFRRPYRGRDRVASSSSSMIVSMTPRTVSRTASSIGSNQSSKSMVPAATAAVFVVFFVMAWSPFRRSNAGISWVSTPETTPTEFQPLPRRDLTAWTDDTLVLERGHNRDDRTAIAFQGEELSAFYRRARDK